MGCSPHAQVLLLVLLSTLAAKALVEGFHTLPSYCPRYGKRTLACFAAGFAVFPLPELFPSETPACFVGLHALGAGLLAQPRLAGGMQGAAGEHCPSTCQRTAHATF